MYYPPTVIEHTKNGERSYDIYSRLLKDRIVFLGTQVDNSVANSIIAQLLFLDMQDPEQDILFYINQVDHYFHFLISLVVSCQ